MAYIGTNPGWNYKQMSATANVKASDGLIGGIFCSSQTSGTVTIYDSATTTTSTKIVDTFNLTAGTFYQLPFAASAGIYIVIGGTASITVAYL